MANPGIWSNLPADESTFPRKLRDLERSAMEDRASVAQSFGPVMADLAAKQAALEAAQVILEAQQVTLAAQQVTLTTQQAALAAQDVQILALLASVIVPATFATTATNFSTAAGGLAIKATKTLTVPAGFTKAVVSANAFGIVNNSSGVEISLQVNAGINGAPGPGGKDNRVPNGALATANASYDLTASNLTGGNTLDVTVWISTTSACAANQSNMAMLTGVVSWLR